MSYSNIINPGISIMLLFSIKIQIIENQVYDKSNSLNENIIKKFFCFIYLRIFKIIYIQIRNIIRSSVMSRI